MSKEKGSSLAESDVKGKKNTARKFRNIYVLRCVVRKTRLIFRFFLAVLSKLYVMNAAKMDYCIIFLTVSKTTRKFRV
jgi:hypothetical protein